MSSRFRIGDLTLDIGRHQLLRESKPIPLGPLTCRLLRTLVEAAPNVVSHDELADSIWAGRSVSPETISQRVKLLRDALSDDPHNPRYIQLVRGQGYRLVPQVEVVPVELPARDRLRWLTPIGGAISLIAAIAVAVVFWIVTAPTGAVRGGSPIVVRESSSIAVLPFVDMSAAGDQRYVADGIAEEILNLLSKATTLRVIARTSSFSFRGKDADIKRIAKTLGVTHVLEGSVRQAGDRVRVTVRLVDASDGSRLWSESYDQGVGDILALQTDVARSVAAELKANLEDIPGAAAGRVSAEAYDLYLRGQQKLRAQSLNEAASYFEQAIAIDDEFIHAYHGLGVAYVLQIVTVSVSVTENREKLREILRRSERLAPDDPGMLALSAQLARYDADIALAEERFGRAQKKDPSNPVLRITYPIFKLDQSNPAEALDLNRRSLEIDPLNSLTYINTWASYMDLWNAEEAFAAAAHLREIGGPSDLTADWLTAITKALVSGDLAGSISDIRRGLSRLDPADAGTPCELPMLYYFIGDQQMAEALMEPARRTPGNASAMLAIEAYRHLVYDDIVGARHRALSALNAPKVWGGDDGDFVILRLATDAMLESSGAREAVAFLEKLAPEYALYKRSNDIDPRHFAPAPVQVKSAFSSYPALYFPDYIRALRAVGDDAGANQMLDHLDAILDLRRRRGLFIEERHVAEALALRGNTEAALDALEKAERDRTIYHRWHLVLLHNEIFSGVRDHPRFVTLVERIQQDLSRQREQLKRTDLAGIDQHTRP